MRKYITLLILLILVFPAYLGTRSIGLQNELISITVNGHRLLVEVANTPATRQVGLMNRKSMAENRGMLFVFPQPGQRTFWMKNTHIPLSIGFFTKGKMLVTLHDMKPDQTTELYPSKVDILYALEVNQGWFAKRGIRKNAKLVLPYPLQGI